MDIEIVEMVWGQFMRVWVSIDITKPLLRGKKINICCPNPIWVRLSHECLPTFVIVVVS